ncbi:MAG: hypothetical protein F6K53_10945 [Moorea sp. SIO4A1]|uniref:hypothetical protein n=1 Tax=Moorena sp. SIO4A1 TaxID=2607835 RepID=UPI00144C7850|nr:hypothetical protein [Moorena sp. SIO4A1]NEQ57890.1 hypothetical protein [Moorena sp. SIO4A1]
MKIEKIIQVFPQIIKTQFEKFELEDLQSLDQVLAALDTKIEETELVNILKKWFKTHKQVRDTIISLFGDNKELKRSPDLPPNSEASILENLFELRQTNKEVIKAKTNQQDQEHSQQ